MQKEKKQILNNYSKYECAMKMIPFWHKIALDCLTCHQNQSIKALYLSFLHTSVNLSYFLATSLSSFLKKAKIEKMLENVGY